MNLFDLFARIVLDTDDYEKGMEEASGKTSAFGEKLKGGLLAAGKAVATGLAATSTAIITLGKASVESFSEFEQLAGGAAKIFDEMDQSKILADAQNAYKTLGINANQYLSIMNDVGATFAATMGDEAGYNTASKGLKAISDYASGTGKNGQVVGYRVGGKTGTADKTGNEDNEIVVSFMCFAPADDPQIAISIYVEKGAQGGRLGHIARLILDAYFSEAGALDMVPNENVTE